MRVTRCVWLHLLLLALSAVSWGQRPRSGRLQRQPTSRRVQHDGNASFHLQKAVPEQEFMSRHRFQTVAQEVLQQHLRGSHPQTVPEMTALNSLQDKRKNIQYEREPVQIHAEPHTARFHSREVQPMQKASAVTADRGQSLQREQRRNSVTQSVQFSQKNDLLTTGRRQNLTNKEEISATSRRISTANPEVTPLVAEMVPLSEKCDEGQCARYLFKTAFHDGIMDSRLEREESREGPLVVGRYSFSDGFFKRTVHYEADKQGYRVVGEETEAIGNGPQIDLSGSVDVSTHIAGVSTGYSVTAADIPRLQRKSV